MFRVGYIRIAFLCLIMLTAELFGDITLSRFTFQLEPGKNGFRLIRDGKVCAVGKIKSFNGMTQQYDNLKVIESVSESQCNKLTLGATDYHIKLVFTPQDNIVLVTGDIVNRSDKELLLQPEIRLEVPRHETDYFFNGLDTLPTEDNPMERLGLKARPVAKIGSSSKPFPVAALIGESLSFFVGQVCFEPVSYNGSIWKPLSDDQAEITFVQRHAIGAGRNVQARLLLGITPTRYGLEEGVVQAVYDAFPELWEPLVGQENPYIWGTHSQYRAWYYRPNYERERRYYSRIEWAYAPYKRSGDIYGHEELWEYKPLVRDFAISFISRFAGEIFDFRKLSLDEFHEKRNRIFRSYARDSGYAFYNSCGGTVCEYTLAREKYPDSITEDTDGVTMIYRNGWSTKHDKEIRVFPMGTSWAKAFREDTKRIYKELDLPGFGLDEAHCGAYYRGPAAQNPDMPGRAWDDKGVYIDQAVAIADYIAFIHNELEPNAAPEDKPFVWANGHSIKADYYMIEATVFSPIFHSWMPNVRYNVGAAPFVMHGKGYLIDETIPNWRNMSREDFLKRLTKMSIYSVFNGFRYGMSSNHVTNNGNPLELYCLPELLELIRLGWQALVPAECHNQGKMLYKARFGRDANTVFFFGNPYAEPMPVDFNIGNDFLGKSQYVFVRKMRDRASTENKLKNGETFFNEILAPRIPYLYEAVCGFSSIPADGLTVTAESAKDINCIRFTLDFKNNPQFRTDILPRAIRNFALKDIQLNGRNIQPENCEIPPNARLVLEYRSTQFLAAAAEILDFPFVDQENRSAFAVQIPAEPNDAEIKQAERIRGYFRFCEERNITAAGKIPLVKSDAQPDTATIRILVGRQCAGTVGVSRDGSTILVKASSPREADELVRQLSHVMDRKFEYFPPFTQVDSISGEMLDKFGIRGENLPFIRCFENDKM